MLTAELINNNIPQLHLQDTVAKALQLVNDYRVSHLAVVEDNTLLGIISEEDLLDEDDDKMPLENLHNSFVLASVLDNVHFLSAVNISLQHDSTVVPVVHHQTKDYLGVITTTNLLTSLGNFAGANEMGGIIVLRMERPKFAISEISRLVESNDCHILHLNTTVSEATGMLTVTVHLNKREISSVVSTFERYDYEVLYYQGDEKFENELDSNYRNFMNYLDI